MRLHLFHLSTWHYALTIEHQGVWDSIPGVFHFCTILQRDAIITQQGSVDVPAFTFGTVYTEQSIALVVSRISVVYYEKTLSKYITSLGLNASDLAILLLATNNDCEHVAISNYSSAKLKRYRYAGPVLQNEYSTTILHSIIHARQSLSYLLTNHLFPASLESDVLSILNGAEASNICNKLQNDFQATARIIMRLASYFSTMKLLIINHEPYSTRLSDNDTPFIIRTKNPYFSLIHIPRGLNQIAVPTSTQLMALLNALSPSEQNDVIMDSGCTLCIQILSSNVADTLNQQYPHTLVYFMRHYFFLPTIAPLLLPFYNINRIFPVLTKPHLSCLHREPSSSVATDIFSGTTMTCSPPLSLKPSVYIELAKRYDLCNLSTIPVWLTAETLQPLSRVGYTYAPYVILSSAFSVHTLHLDDCKFIVSRAKTLEEKQSLYFCQGRLATEISFSGAILSDIGILKHAVLTSNDKTIRSTNLEVCSLASAVVPICNQSSIDESMIIGSVETDTISEVISPFSNKAHALEQQLAIIHAVYEDLYIAITAGPPAHSTNNSNTFYSLSCEDSWRAYQLNCFRYWQNTAPYIDTEAASSLNSYEAIMKSDIGFCSYSLVKTLPNKSVQPSKRDIKLYLSTQPSPLPLCSLMKRPTVVDKRWTLQQQVILYTPGMEKRFALSTGQIYLYIRLHYPRLNLYVLRIETARILTCGQFVTVLVLVEDINLSVSDYLKALSDSIVFTRVPSTSSLPSTSVYHCLFTCSLDGAFIGIQPLLLGGLGRYHKPDDADASTIRTLCTYTKQRTDAVTKTATAPFDSTFPVYTGPLAVSIYSRILSDVSNIATSVSSSVYLCLRNLHLILQLDVLTGARTLIGFPYSLLHPYATKFVASSGIPLPIFMGIELQPILLPVSASSIVGELLSDHTDTEVVDNLQRSSDVENDQKLSVITYMLEESDDIRTPGYCTDTSEGEGDGDKRGTLADLRVDPRVRLSLPLGDDGRQFLGPRLFKPNRLSITHCSKKYGVSVILDDNIMHFLHYPVAISRFHFKDVHLIAVIGQGRNANYWGIAFTECTFKGSCSLVRQMVVDLGVPYTCESHPILNTVTSQTPSSSTGKISTATISCTGDSLIFSIPTKSLMPGESGQVIPATRLVEIGFYTELRQIVEVAGTHRTHTPFRVVNHQMRPVEGSL